MSAYVPSCPPCLLQQPGRSTRSILRLTVLAFGCLLWLGRPAPARSQVQTDVWTWIGGSSTVPLTPPTWPYGQPGVYGMQGVASAANIPGGRYEAVTWTDNNGNFWLFGGDGFDAAHKNGYLNDLWEFNVTTREWTWMSGSSTVPASGGQPGTYGALLTPAMGNTPGGRAGALGWTDAAGNLWLFGGEGFDANGNEGDLNDLWKYNISSGEWEWMGGASTLGSAGNTAGVYGTQGSLSSSNYPGSRNSAITWVDNEGNFWMFGGWGEDSLDHSGDLNDLWEFVPSTGQWAWMSGSSTIRGSGWSGVYGMEGAAQAGNTPGARETPTGWIDASGNLWLFGGYGYTTTPSGAVTHGFLNDVWEFTPATQEWAWMGGSSQLPNSCASGSDYDCGLPGVYGTKGQPAMANIPGGRVSSTVWLNSGNIWLLGGEGYDATGNDVYELNDLWQFNPQANEWTWMGGPSTVSGFGQSGTYGTENAGSPQDTPGGRFYAAAWTGHDGSFWLQGGGGIDAKGNLGYLNDVWVYGTPETLATLAPPTFNPPAGTYTSVQMVALSDAAAGATIYYTTDGTTPTTDSTVYTGPIAVSASETIQAYAAAGGFLPSPTSSAAYTIDIPVPTFTLGLSQNSLTVDSGGNGIAMATVTPLNGFNSSVNFACSGLPAGATCTFSPATVTPAGNPVGAQLTITIPAQARLEQRKAPWVPGSTFALAACFLLFRRRKPWRLSAFLVVAALGAGLLSGCGTLILYTIPSTSTVTVTATSGTLQQTAPLTLTVN